MGQGARGHSGAPHPGARARATCSRRERSDRMDLNTLYHRTVESWADRVNARPTDQWDWPHPVPGVDGARSHQPRRRRGPVDGTARCSGSTIEEVGDRFDGDLLGDDPIKQRAGGRHGGDPGRRGDAARRTAPCTCPTARSRWTSTSTSSPPTTWSTAGTSPSPPAATPASTRRWCAEVAAWFADREDLYRQAGMIGARGVRPATPRATCSRRSAATRAGGSNA